MEFYKKITKIFEKKITCFEQGESGAGKTVAAKLILKYICAVSPGGGGYGAMTGAHGLNL